MTIMPKPNVREQLLDAGLRTLHTQGFNGCAVNDITVAAGVPKGSFYNHFESKDALALGALDRFWEAGESRRALLSDVTRDPVDRLRSHFQALSDAVVRSQFKKGCLIGNFSAEMPSNDAFNQRLRKIYLAWSRAVAACVLEAQEAGRLRTTASPDAIAAFLVNAWEGAVLRAKVERKPSALEDFQGVVFTSLFN